MRLDIPHSSMFLPMFIVAPPLQHLSVDVPTEIILRYHESMRLLLLQNVRGFLSRSWKRRPVILRALMFVTNNMANYESCLHVIELKRTL